MGDPTPQLQNRLTLNPLYHLDPIGTLMIIVGPIGWAKPVQVNPYNFSDPERDFMISTAWGPISNIIQGTFWALMIRVSVLLRTQGMWDVTETMFFDFLILAATINFVLALFNMVPLGPLDGHRVIPYFLPFRQKEAYQRFNKQYGMPVLFGLIAVSFVSPINVLEYVIFRPALFVVSLISGLRF